MVGITYPLVFKIYKLKSRLKAGDEYQSKPQIAVEMIREIQAMGFVIERMLADSLYGESSNFVEVLHPLKLPVSLRFSQVIAFTQFNSTVPENVIGCRHMEIDVRQNKVQEIGQPLKGHSVFPHR